MSEQLGTKDHAAIATSVLAMAHYVCEWADDQTLFSLLATLAHHAAQVAARLDNQRYMGPPPSAATLPRDHLAVAMPTPNSGGTCANGPG